MNVEHIEIKAKLDHKHDELAELVNAMPDSLKKRMRLFLNSELRTVGETVLKANEENDENALRIAFSELAVLDQISNLQELLPE